MTAGELVLSIIESRIPPGIILSPCLGGERRGFGARSWSGVRFKLKHRRPKSHTAWHGCSPLKPRRRVSRGECPDWRRLLWCLLTAIGLFACLDKILQIDCWFDFLRWLVVEHNQVQVDATGKASPSGIYQYAVLIQNRVSTSVDLFTVSNGALRPQILAEDGYTH